MKHVKLICPSPDDAVFGIDPANAGFDREEILRLIEERCRGRSYEVLNGNELSAAERATVYFTEAVPAAGNRYRIGSVYGSASKGGGPHLGTGVPVLIVYEDGQPVGVYPNRTKDGTYHTIRDFLESL